MAPSAPLPSGVITPRFHARIWGSRDLRAWYPARGPEAEPIGEAWLTPPEFPVLVKLLFPAQRLSVQVHPDDAYAAAHGLGRGKTEMWYVLEAVARDGVAPRLGVGLRAGVEWSAFWAACECGRGADLLDWMEVTAGELIYIPAGTVHAVGPGVVLCEVQQPSDNTFRLDDYGRLDSNGQPRALHLDQGMAVARATLAGKIDHHIAPTQSGVLLDSEFFKVAQYAVPGGATATIAAARGSAHLLVNLGGDLPGLPRGHALALAPGAIHSCAGPARLLHVTVVSVR